MQQVPTIEELSEPFGNYLLPVLSRDAGICPICFSVGQVGFQRCYQCTRALEILETTADALAFIALAYEENQFARDLTAYKSDRTQGVSSRTRLGLAAVLWRWLAHHESCVAHEVGTEGFEVVTSIPSIRRPTAHPLQTLVSQIVKPTADRYRSLLMPNMSCTPDREFRKDRFTVAEKLDRIDGILVIDDTFTMGTRAQGAAFALKQAGATRVGVLAMGRRFSVPPQEPYRSSHERYLQSAKKLIWDWTACPICR
jgi:predicted amidophosphoribosyltransferase